MNFRYWAKSDKRRLYVASDKKSDNGFIDITSKGIRAVSFDDTEKSELASIMLECGLSSMRAVEDIVQALQQNGHHVTGFRSSSLFAGAEAAKKRLSDIHEAVDMRSPAEIIQQIKVDEIGRAPFKKSTLKKIEVTVDSREPEAIKSCFKVSPIPWKCEALPIGDFQIKDLETGDTMLIERKTISDLYSSTINTHLHSQAERLYEWERTSGDARKRVVWIFESEQNGMRSLYNALPQFKQIDGLMNYFVAVLGQHTLSTYNPAHTVYLIHKLAQGFLEQELPYPVKSDNGRRVDVVKKARAHEVKSDDTSSGHGVVEPGRDYQIQMLCAIPSINTRIARSLLESGLVFADILRLTEGELCLFDGVGKKTAQKIAHEFSVLC